MKTLKNAALLSVTNKSRIVDIATAISATGRPLVSTGGTAETLRAAGLDVIDVSDITNFPSIMDGRLKTLNSKVFGGILYDRNKEQHIIDAEQVEIDYGFDIVVVNLYDFEGKPSIEQIDIGGPSLIRAGSKNWRHVTVLTDPAQYDVVIQELKRFGDTDEDTRQYLASHAFAATAKYDTMISKWFANEVTSHRIYMRTGVPGSGK